MKRSVATFSHRMEEQYKKLCLESGKEPTIQGMLAWLASIGVVNNTAVNRCIACCEYPYQLEKHGTKTTALKHIEAMHDIPYSTALSYVNKFSMKILRLPLSD